MGRTFRLLMRLALLATFAGLVVVVKVNASPSASPSLPLSADLVPTASPPGGITSPDAPSPTVLPTQSPTQSPTRAPTFTSTPTRTSTPSSPASPTSTARSSSTSQLRAASCTQGTWVGLPYLNRFYNSDCSTYVAANSFSNLTITATSPSYVVYMENNVTVSAGGAMTVTQGVTIEANSANVLYVLGNLDLAGTASQPITLTASSGPSGKWAGIGFRPGSSG